jgi:hypothetical protein
MRNSSNTPLNTALSPLLSCRGPVSRDRCNFSSKTLSSNYLCQDLAREGPLWPQLLFYLLTTTRP